MLACGGVRAQQTRSLWLSVQGGKDFAMMQSKAVQADAERLRRIASGWGDLTAGFNLSIVRKFDERHGLSLSAGYCGFYPELGFNGSYYKKHPQLLTGKRAPFDWVGIYGFWVFGIAYINHVPISKRLNLGFTGGWLMQYPNRNGSSGGSWDNANERMWAPSHLYLRRNQALQGGLQIRYTTGKGGRQLFAGLSYVQGLNTIADVYATYWRRTDPSQALQPVANYSLRFRGSGLSTFVGYAFCVLKGKKAQP